MEVRLISRNSSNNLEKWNSCINLIPTSYLFENRKARVMLLKLAGQSLEWCHSQLVSYYLQYEIFHSQIYSVSVTKLCTQSAANYAKSLNYFPYAAFGYVLRKHCEKKFVCKELTNSLVFFINFWLLQWLQYSKIFCSSRFFSSNSKTFFSEQSLNQATSVS